VRSRRKIKTWKKKRLPVYKFVIVSYNNSYLSKNGWDDDIEKAKKFTFLDAQRVIRKNKYITQFVLREDEARIQITLDS